MALRRRLHGIRILLPLLLAWTPGGLAWAQSTIPRVASGRIDRIGPFPSRHVTERIVDVWLPEGYSDTNRYAVLYMHDGQMLYDASQTWNRQAWDVDDVATALMTERKVRDFIVVGIWNGGQTRHPDYFPQRPFEQLKPAEQDTVNAQLQRAARTTGRFQPRSDAYLRFLVEELKPYIDRRYAVHTDPANTSIAGSSMGGLISLYALCEYPAVFGAAACLSTHWIGTFTAQDNPLPDAFLRYLERKLPDPGTHRVYFDCGDQTLDALYPAIQRRVDAVMARKGYTAANGLTRYFPGDDHSEASWNRRLDVPLVFLFGR